LPFGSLNEAKSQHLSHKYNMDKRAELFHNLASSAFVQDCAHHQLNHSLEADLSRYLFSVAAVVQKHFWSHVYLADAEEMVFSPAS
jgi:hypothetical protein